MITIRRYKPEDNNELAKLISLFRKELRELKDIKSKASIKEGKEDIEDFIRLNYPIFVAIDDEKPVGYVVIRIDNGCCWTEQIYVDKKHRRKGIATKLFKKAENHSKKHYGETLYNYIHPNNEKIINFLAKQGYDVLNLIEIRKAYKNENPKQTIEVNKHNYRY